MWQIFTFLSEILEGWAVDRLRRFVHRSDMKKTYIIAKAIQVLSYLFVVFALVFFPPTATHAASGAHAGQASLFVGSEPANLASHAHATLPTDCGTKTDASAFDSALDDCCASLCVTVILLGSFSWPQSGSAVMNPVLFDPLFVAADSDGFLRPPKHLI